MKVVHCKREPYDVYIGRPSKWGNPFSHKEGTKAFFKVNSVEEAIRLYTVWLAGQPDLLAALPELRGKTLGCWCAPGPCHGDVLLKWANDEIQVPSMSDEPHDREALSSAQMGDSNEG
jgi:hypothetical protein